MMEWKLETVQDLADTSPEGFVLSKLLDGSILGGFSLKNYLDGQNPRGFALKKCLDSQNLGRMMLEKSFLMKSLRICFVKELFYRYF